MKEILQRVNQYLLFSVLLVLVMYYARVILIPVVFGALLSMLMAPVCRRLDQRGLHRTLSCLACILILLITLIGIFSIIVAEITTFSQDVSLLEKKATELLSQLQSFIQEKFNIAPEKQISIAKEQVNKAGDSAGGYIGNILGGLTTTLAGILLTLVYTFLFLYNKEKYESFFLKLYKGEEPGKVKEVVQQISHVAQQYLTGRAMSVLILATLYSIGLLIIGIKNAVILAGIAALLTIVPYLGSVLGGFFPFMMALVTEESYEPALWVGGVIIFIQAIDNYFIEPNVVGGEVNLSALSSIMSIIAGGLLWGIAGMILFIPMLGIAKIIFDHVEPLKPYGYLIGDPEGDKPSKIKMWILNKFGKAKRKGRKKVDS